MLFRSVEESRELLVVAVTNIFSNLVRLQPSLDLKDVMAPPSAISNKARETATQAAIAFAKKFDQVVIEGNDEEDALEEEAETAVDKAGTSGGATA